MKIKQKMAKLAQHDSKNRKKSERFAKNMTRFPMKFRDRSGVKAWTSFRSRQELSNEYLSITCKIWLRYSRLAAIFP